MKKRFIQIGDYATADAGFTLCKWSLSPAVYRAVRETVPGMDGAADCSALLTGDVQYDVRTLTAVLELSEKTRDYRLGAIAHLINRFDGRTEQIEKVRLGDIIRVIREPDNPFNPNNFQLFTEKGKSVGNMPAELCNAIAPLYDSGELRFIGASVSYVEPISKRNRHAKQAMLFVELKCRV